MTSNPPLVTSPNEPLPSSSDPRRDIYAIIRGFVFLGFIAFLLWLAGDVLLILFAGVLVAIFIGGIAGWIRTHTKASRSAQRGAPPRGRQPARAARKVALGEGDHGPAPERE
jgi:hypothetical protein